MEEPSYLIQKYSKEKIYNPYRCPDCYKMLRIKIFIEGNIIKYYCQCKRDWYISYKIDKSTSLIKPRKFDQIFNLKCSKCNQFNNLEYKFMLKCLTCNKLFCNRKSCNKNHIHKTKNIIFYDITCDIHSKDFIAYCKTCDRDICDLCIINEKKINHEIIYYKDIMPPKEKIIEKYNYFNKISDYFVTQFKGERRKTNVRMIYFFHIREILRNCYINFSRYSKINKFNFALISNILENSDFITDPDNPKLILDYKYAPTWFIYSSKYFFSFLEDNYNTKINLLKNINNNNNNEYAFIKKIYCSFPKKKYFLIQTSTLNLYDALTFRHIYDLGNYQIDNAYNFEDERLICQSQKKNSFLFVEMYKKEKNEVKHRKFKIKYEGVYLLKNSFLIRENDKFYIYDYQGKIKLSFIISNIENKYINKDMICISDYIIYFEKWPYNEIYLYQISTKKKDKLDFRFSINSINKLDEKNIILKTDDYQCPKSRIIYIINVPLKQIVNKYAWSSKYNFEIISEYIIISKKPLKNEKIFINALSSKINKKLYNLDSNAYLGSEAIKHNEVKTIILNKYILFYNEQKIIAIYRFK